MSVACLFNPRPSNPRVAAVAVAIACATVCATTSAASAQADVCDAVTAIHDPLLPEGEYGATDGLFRLYGLAAQSPAASDYFVEVPGEPLTLVHDPVGGTLTLTGRVQCREDASQRLVLDLGFYDELQATCWLAQAEIHNLLIGYDPSNGNATCPHHPDSMSVFLMSPESHATAEGSWAGQLLFWHMPMSGSKRFQYGLAGSEHSCNDGFGGWFAYSGMIDGAEVFGLSADIHADVQNCTGYAPGQSPAALCGCDPGLQGCTDPDACNYDEGAVCDDGTCDHSCCPGPGCCAEGMHWDWDLGQCQTSLPGDADGDGCVGLGDLLVLLTGYNNCSTLAPVPTCGDPVSYQGYDYGTVDIGGQCWFVENLRVEAFRNGDSIPTSLDDAAWTGTAGPARTTYGAGTSNCTSTVEAFDACDEAEALAAFGRLYNWHAVTDDRHLCPEGWHVPSDAEWMALEMHLGMSESDAQGVAFRGTDQGTQLKAVEGWSEGGNGTDDHGFAALPHGYRYTTGAYFFAGTLNFYWSSTLSDDGMAWYRALLNSSPKVSRNKSDTRNGYGVRCLRDDV